ncbi:MAG: hypothetical protein Q8O67_15235 [Deltaproteobacteria bacterium]|nr:hypothetical protein [Deltaproteobacteria bacterium]
MKKLALAVSLALAASCEAPPIDAHDPMGSLEAALFDQLECSNLSRPSTIEHLRDALHHPERIGALLFAPHELASVVALAGPQAEAAVVVVRNLLRLVNSGAGQELLEHGWDGVQCGEPVSLECTAGRGSVIVDCEVGTVHGIRIEAEACTIHGENVDGALDLRRGDDDDAVIVLDGLTINETKELQGELVLHHSVDDDLHSFAVRSPATLRLVDHGGPQGGRSCGEELRLQDLDVSVDDDDVSVAFAGFQENRARKLGLGTVDDELVFDGACGCPRAGAGLQVEVPHPLGHQDETAIATVRWVKTSLPGFCAAAEVELADWPSTCADLHNLDGDCAQQATASSLSVLLSAFCVEK